MKARGAEVFNRKMRSFGGSELRRGGTGWSGYFCPTGLAGERSSIVSLRSCYEPLSALQRTQYQSGPIFLLHRSADPAYLLGLVDVGSGIFPTPDPRWACVGLAYVGLLR